MGYYYYLSSNERTERAMRSDARVVSTLRWPLIVIFIRAELFQKNGKRNGAISPVLGSILYSKLLNKLLINNVHSIQ